MVLPLEYSPLPSTVMGANVLKVSSMAFLLEADSVPFSILRAWYSAPSPPPPPDVPPGVELPPFVLLGPNAYMPPAPRMAPITAPMTTPMMRLFFPDAGLTCCGAPYGACDAWGPDGIEGAYGCEGPGLTP